MHINQSGSAFSTGGNPFSRTFRYLERMRRVERKNGGKNPNALFPQMWKDARDTCKWVFSPVSFLFTVLRTKKKCNERKDG
jgi:hypothetical protein